MSRLSRWLSPRFVLPLAVVLGLNLRLVPAMRHPDFPFVHDAAYHLRLIEGTLGAGQLPAIDRRSNAPEGRHTARELPVGLYAVAASAHRGLSALGLVDLKWNLESLIAFCGGLIALPVWLGARAAFGSSAAASCAALGSVVLPAHLQRTYGYWLRYDALGTLLVATHVALALASLASSEPWRRRALAAGSALFLVGAASVWRVSFLALGIELVFVGVRLVTRGSQPALRDVWVAIAVLGTLGLAFIEYLSVRGFLLSAPWLAVAGLAVALCLPPLREGGRRSIRVAALVVILGLAWWLGQTQVPAGYAGLTALLPGKLGVSRGHDPLAVLMLQVEELASMSPLTLAIGSQEFFALGIWLVAAPFLFWWLAGRPSLVRGLRIEPAPALLATVTAGLAAFALLFERTSVLLAPFAAMTLGGLGARLVATTSAHVVRAPAASAHPGRAPNAARRREVEATRRSGSGRRWLLAALLASGLATAVAGVVQALSSGALMPPEEEIAIRFLRDHAPRGAVILSWWDAGYDIQTIARRATVVDGLLESEENRRRILATGEAFMRRTPDALESLCARYRARWLLVPPLPYIYTVAAVVGDPIATRIAHDLPLRIGVDTERVLYHLMAEDVTVPRFQLAYRVGDYRVYEYLPIEGSTP